MKYFEFGTENKVTLLLLHGVDTTWEMSFQPFIDVAKSKYHIIAVAEDGFNPDEPEVDATSVIDEAHRITEWLTLKQHAVYPVALMKAVTMKIPRIFRSRLS